MNHSLVERDRMWCTALICLDARQIAEVTKRFNTLRDNLEADARFRQAATDPRKVEPAWAEPLLGIVMLHAADSGGSVHYGMDPLAARALAGETERGGRRRRSVAGHVSTGGEVTELTREWLDARGKASEILDRYLVSLRRSGNLVGQLEDGPYSSCTNALADLATTHPEGA